MKGKYITTRIQLACLSTRQHKEKNIHEELEQTIAEHKKIMQQFRTISLFQINNSDIQNKEAA